MRKKLIILCFLCLFVSALGISAQAAGKAKITVGDVSGAPGDAVAVPISIKDNPGFGGAIMILTYDTTKLEAVGLTPGLISPIGGMSENIMAGIGVRLVYVNMSGTNFTRDGILYYVLFIIPEDAEPGNLEIGFETEEFIDVEPDDMPEVAYDAVTGTLTILNPGETGSGTVTASTGITTEPAVNQTLLYIVAALSVIAIAEAIIIAALIIKSHRRK